MTDVEGFVIAFPEEALADVRQRLGRARLAPDFANDDWRYGTNGDYLRELIAHWRDRYDWRRHEAEMNRFAHFRTDIQGVPIHFIHQRGRGPHPLPLILSHGWPWTFWDMHKVIGPLADPASFGGAAEDAFDVVVPSLPGYGFSTPLKVPGISAVATADLWQRLMNEVLGYDRFAAHGADWGALITAQLGHKHGERLAGIHIANGAPLNFFTTGLPGAEDYAESELEGRARAVQRMADGHGYLAIQSTRPQTLAYGLVDSPVGLCAWLLDKRREWSDCDGDVERSFTKDELLTSVMLYWLTESAGTAARSYYEMRHNPWQPSHDRTPLVDVPTGIIRFRHDVCYSPRRVMERHYDIRHWTEVPKGGHFAPMEMPDALVDDLRAFFRPLRG